MHESCHFNTLYSKDKLKHSVLLSHHTGRSLKLAHAKTSSC
uniref:Uncharacterized protein n=1 Tax=Arundo donax TaxID=35708 RepID=A0A0A9H3C4_ARUDO